MNGLVAFVYLNLAGKGYTLLLEGSPDRTVGQRINQILALQSRTSCRLLSSYLDDRRYLSINVIDLEGVTDDGGRSVILAAGAVTLGPSPPAVTVAAADFLSVNLGVLLATDKELLQRCAKEQRPQSEVEEVVFKRYVRRVRNELSAWSKRAYPAVEGDLMSDKDGRIKQRVDIRLILVTIALLLALALLLLRGIPLARTF